MKSTTSVMIDADVLTEARRTGINISQAAESGIVRACKFAPRIDLDVIGALERLGRQDRELCERVVMDRPAMAKGWARRLRRESGKNITPSMLIAFYRRKAAIGVSE